jgi:hypothetical protein
VRSSTAKLSGSEYRVGCRVVRGRGRVDPLHPRQPSNEATNTSWLGGSQVYHLAAECVVVVVVVVVVAIVYLSVCVLYHSNMESVQNLPPHQQQAFMRELEQMQMKDSLT